jgi:predicted  nucleic acid-binding Zn-ribbon protein
MAESKGNRETRLDRIERALELLVAGHEQFRADHKQLLIAQVVQSEQIAENSKHIAALTNRIDAQANQMDDERTARKESDAALDKRVADLVSSISDLVRRIPPENLR